jgi:hypothetical protein
VTPLTQANNTCVPVTYLISSPDGTIEGNGESSHPVVSDSGTFVAFESQAANLGPSASNTNPATHQIYAEQQCLGASTCSRYPLSLISTYDGTTPGSGGTNIEPAISFDGRFVAFASTATNLGVTASAQQIYLRDTCSVTTVTTCLPSTTLVSTSNGSTPGSLLSENPSINQNSTGSGEFVAFASLATNLATNISNGVENIFVRETCATAETTGTTGTTTTTACAPGLALASLAAGSSPPAANGSSLMPSISGDAHTVSFLSFASNLVPRDTNGLEDIFLAATSF